jgi:hypothetical protein
MIRLVTQFDPPTRHASVATATCSSCSCSCCCCCLVSAAAVAGFTVMNLRAVAREREHARSVWPLLGAVVVCVVGVPVIGLALFAAAYGLANPSTNTGVGGVVLFGLFAIVVASAILAATYHSVGARHPWLAGGLTTIVGGLIAAGEGYSFLSLSSSNGSLPLYLILVVVGAFVGVGIGAAVDQARKAQ